MLLKITHLKAPWPTGAKVGDVIELPSVPAWALGKCQPAPDGAEATVGPVGSDEPAPDGAATKRVKKAAE